MLATRYRFPILSVAAIACLVAACSSAGDDAATAGGTTSAATGGTTTGSTGGTTSGGGAATSSGTSGTTSGAGGAASTSASSSASSSSSTGSGGGGGAAPGAECDPPCMQGELCSHPAGLFAGKCGKDGAPGTCIAAPSPCMPHTGPFCGCDGVTYQDECAAFAAGVDIGDGDCAPPAGQFECDALFCYEADEGCGHDPTGGSTFCTSLPQACINQPGVDCSCFGPNPGCEACAQDAEGHFLLTCST